MKRTQPKLIGSSIHSVIQHLGIGKKLKHYEAVDAWPRIVGEQISRVATAQRIEHGKLFVHVSHSAWRNELVFLKNALIDKINKEMNEDVVKDIIFR